MWVRPLPCSSPFKCGRNPCLFHLKGACWHALVGESCVYCYRCLGPVCLACVWVCMCVLICTFVCMRKPRADVGTHALLLFCLQRGLSTIPRARLSSRLESWRQLALRIPCLRLPRQESPAGLDQAWGPELVFTLPPVWPALYPWATSHPSPTLCLLLMVYSSTSWVMIPTSEHF